MTTTHMPLLLWGLQCFKFQALGVGSMLGCPCSSRLLSNSSIALRTQPKIPRTVENLICLNLIRGLDVTSRMGSRGKCSVSGYTGTIEGNTLVEYPNLSGVGLAEPGGLPVTIEQNSCIQRNPDETLQRCSMLQQQQYAAAAAATVSRVLAKASCLLSEPTL